MTCARSLTIDPPFPSLLNSFPSKPALPFYFFLPHYGPRLTSLLFFPPHSFLTLLSQFIFFFLFFQPTFPFLLSTSFLTNPAFSYLIYSQSIPTLPFPFSSLPLFSFLFFLITPSPFLPLIPLCHAFPFPPLSLPSLFLLIFSSFYLISPCSPIPLYSLPSLFLLIFSSPHLNSP